MARRSIDLQKTLVMSGFTEEKHPNGEIAYSRKMYGGWVVVVVTPPRQRGELGKCRVQARTDEGQYLMSTPFREGGKWNDVYQAMNRALNMIIEHGEIRDGYREPKQKAGAA